MLRRIVISVIIGILTSLYLFPFNTTWLPAVNTKMALAVVGLCLIMYKATTAINAELRSDLLKLTIVAALVSLIGLISVSENNTDDYTYATYIISMWVWLAGAYTVIFAMKIAYGELTFSILANYLIAVCIAQCALAQLIHYIPAVASFIDSIMVSQGFMGKMEGRLYGLGCALDVAGLKFSGILIIIMFLAINVSARHAFETQVWYILAFAVVTILGSMIARTTSVGTIVSLSYLLFYTIYRYLLRPDDSENVLTLWKAMIWVMLIVGALCFILYRSVEPFREMFDFGFEGFISFIETGKWEVRSNRQLMAQWYWPDNLKTWIIGDGYFNSPNSDAYYIGENYEGYYKGTDVGWCRFIFYFGLTGLVSFILFFIYLSYLCGKLHPRYRLLFWLLALMNFIGWNKVSSDIFPIFALSIILGSTGERKAKSYDVENEPGDASPITTSASQ